MDELRDDSEVDAEGTQQRQHGANQQDEEGCGRTDETAFADAAEAAEAHCVQHPGYDQSDAQEVNDPGRGLSNIFLQPYSKKQIEPGTFNFLICYSSVWPTAKLGTPLALGNQGVVSHPRESQVYLSTATLFRFTSSQSISNPRPGFCGACTNPCLSTSMSSTRPYLLAPLAGNTS